MQIQAWSIRGRSFHFGLHGLGQEETGASMPSDSLFAALVARLARSGGAAAADAFCRPFLAGQPPFLLTSTFPLAGEVRFFPPPLCARRTPEKYGGDSKVIKRVAYVSEQLYRRLLEGETLAELGRVSQLQDQELWISAEEFQRLPKPLCKEGAKLWAKEQRPRVKLDRATSASELFFTGQVAFAEQCGLWFGLRWLAADQALRRKVANLLADLADAGLGAERASGLGQAQIAVFGDLDLPDPTQAWTTLSRYLPREDEMAPLAHPDTAYIIKTVGGWLDSPVRPGQRRKTVNLLAEGSVFGSLPRPVPGQVADVRPRYKTDPDPLKHPVYRSGLALAVGLKGARA
jgi:CRISPR-associated protein Csm4